MMALLCRECLRSREAHLDQALLGQVRARKEGLGLSAGQPPIAVPVGLRKPGVNARVRHAIHCALAALRGSCCWLAKPLPSPQHLTQPGTLQQARPAAGCP